MMLSVHGRGTVLYRLVGADLSHPNLTADVELSVGSALSNTFLDRYFGSGVAGSEVFVQVATPTTNVRDGAPCATT